MSVTLFYRVERNGIGPYTSYDWNTELELGAMSDAHGGDDYDTHPNPWEDKGIVGQFRKGTHVCGFTSLDKAKSWFEGWGTFLAKYGFLLCVYRVDPIAIVQGQYQDVADKNALVDMVDIMSPEVL